MFMDRGFLAYLLAPLFRPKPKGSGFSINGGGLALKDEDERKEGWKRRARGKGREKGVSKGMSKGIIENNWKQKAKRKRSRRKKGRKEKV